jgi:phospholipase C
MIRPGLCQLLGAAAIGALAAGCAGTAGGSGTPSSPRAQAALYRSAVAQMASAGAALSEDHASSGNVVLEFKAAGPRGKARGPSGYVSPATNGFAVTAYPSGGTPPNSPTAVFNVSSTSPKCATSSRGVRTCKLAFSAPAPSADFIFSAYDQPPSKRVPTGNLLSTATVTDVPISSSGSNTVPIAMGGVPATLTLAPQTQFLLANGKNYHGHMTVLSQDADGYIIVGNEPFPTPITLSVGGDPSGTIALSESQVQSPANAAFKYTYNGGPLLTATVTAAMGSLQSQATLNPLNYSPHSLTLAPNASANVTLQLTNYDGPFSLTPLPTPAPSATPDANCTAAAGPGSSDGSPVQISITALTPGTCEVVVNTYARSNNGQISVQISGPTPTPSPMPPAGSVSAPRLANGDAPPSPAGPVQIARGLPPQQSGSGDGRTHGKLPIPPAGKIQHVVIIVQENRSFNYLFEGFPNATTTSSGQTPSGSVALTQVSLACDCDIEHNHTDFLYAYDGGKMDGFEQEENCKLPCSKNRDVNYWGPLEAYQYGLTGTGSGAELAPYWTLAQKYALADQMFASESGGSYEAHQYLIAGQSDMVMYEPSGSPWGCDAPRGTYTGQLTAQGDLIVGPFPCFNYKTIGDLMDAKGLGWRMYAPAIDADVGYLWSAFDAIGHIRFGPDWTEHVIDPPAQVLTDISNGDLAPLTYVIPDLINSDHAYSNSNTGPSWVSSIVNAVGASQFWPTTAIFILWDDWGGWYDSIPPQQLDVMGLGIRVPLIVVSPYAVHGYVSHVPHEFGSILHFTEETFKLPSLHQVDARADDLSDMFDFSQSVTPLQKVRTPYSVREVIEAGRRSKGPPDSE